MHIRLSAQAIHLVWSVFAMRFTGGLGSKLSSGGQWRVWSDWGHAQANLSLCWAHSFVVRRIKCCVVAAHSNTGKLIKHFACRSSLGPRQANLVLIAYASSESRGTFRQKARSLAPQNGWACAVKICHDGMLEDTNSLDGALLISF